MPIQVGQRVWDPRAVHDTVRAAARELSDRRSLAESILERLSFWLGDVIAWLRERLGFSPVSRTVGLSIVAIIVLLLVVRLLVAAHARDDRRRVSARRGRNGANEEPFAAADQLAAQGRFEEAAHALYRGVLLSLARRDRLRLDPSKTSGDYARELRARGASSLPSFRAFARRFDVAVYGHGQCDAELIADLRRLARPFSPHERAA
jgi:hypothetical protein